ncbi:MAG: endonuclease/exonuclease/phosphatase family protein [Solirubrobacterales bacterium]
MPLRVLTWNLFHGRDFPPDPRLLTWRSRLLRITERNATHLQVNRDLHEEFASLLAAALWDVALLQECPPRWSARLAAACRAEPHRVLTARNSLAPLRSAIARLNPDLIASNEGGSNLTLVRPAAGTITARDELELGRGPGHERRTMALTRFRQPGAATETCVANLHASAGAARRAIAEQQVLAAAEHAIAWAAEDPLVFGGDLNLRPRQTDVFARLRDRFGLAPATAPDALDHLLARGLELVEPPRQWPPERREIAEGGRAIRLSDHAPVQATFEVANLTSSSAAE